MSLPFLSRLAMGAAAAALIAAVPVPAVASAGQGAWPARVTAPRGAPNVLLIMTDDVGFGASSAYGGPIATPVFDALARGGARYNNFNTTALCSPTRASLLTGRDPHNVNMGNVTNMPTGFEGYTTAIPRSAATVARILRDGGYSTAMFGKSHLTPDWELSADGPFDRWPTGLGFDYFYGFLSADTNQTAPNLYENTRPIAPPDEPGYLLDTDLADRAIGWISAQHAAAPGKPFFVYYAPGTAHSPHTAPAEWLRRYRGAFDQGWDKVREESFARQKALGIIPADAALAARPPGIPAWDSLTPDQKRLSARMMEAYAASLAYCDAQIGRVIEHLRRTGQLADTMIVFLQGDNGGSAEGGPMGMIFEQTAVLGSEEDPADQMRRIDDIGTGRAYTMYPAGWGWAMNAPFPWYKQVASHAGGTRNGLVIAWPGHGAAPETVRGQYAHVSDIVPTILSATGVAAPKTVDGVAQQPFDGISLAYTLDRPTAPARRRTQVYEMMENFGIYRDGWFAGSTPKRYAWQFATRESLADPQNRDRHWELYDLRTDFSQTRDLAAAQPAKLKALQALFWKRAARNHILPIHDYKLGAEGRPTLNAGRDVFTYSALVSRVPYAAAPPTTGRSFTIEADVTIPADGGRGVLLAAGGRFGGHAFFLDDGRPAFHVNAVGPHQYELIARDRLSPGRHRLAARFVADDATPGSGGAVLLLVDGVEVARGRADRVFYGWLQNTEGFDIGEDTLTPVSPRYDVAGSRFTGTIEQVVVRLDSAP
ncbi:arylsulfatase [Rhizorhabdus wittichii DC-6]|nr:arylsulfatase [Rhizorhabdus wittichii DC-6]